MEPGSWLSGVGTRMRIGSPSAGWNSVSKKLFSRHSSRNSTALESNNGLNALNRAPAYHPAPRPGRRELPPGPIIRWLWRRTNSSKASSFPPCVGYQSGIGPHLRARPAPWDGSSRRRCNFILFQTRGSKSGRSQSIGGVCELLEHDHLTFQICSSPKPNPKVTMPPRNSEKPTLI